MGATGAGEATADPMSSPTLQLRPTQRPGRVDRAAMDGTGDERGEDVSPVHSDAIGVRQSGGRGREDATRSRRRFITH
jgi:hypothetical protein